MALQLLKGNFDFPSDTIYLALYTSVTAYPVASATVYSSATAGQVAATGNYVTDGRTCGAATVANAGSQPQSIYLNFAGDGSGANTITWSTATITAAAASFPLAVFIGSTLGMGTIMFLTAALGSLFFDKIDAEKLEKIAAILFIVAGLWIAISTFLG